MVKVQIFDWDMLSGDDLIGETEVFYIIYLIINYYINLSPPSLELRESFFVWVWETILIWYLENLALRDMISKEMRLSRYLTPAL